jgi:hypothetical protein
MPVRGRLLALFAPLLLLVLPACGGTGPLLPLRPKVDPIPPTPVKTTSSKARPAGVQFAVLPRVPGETVALNPTAAETLPVPVDTPPDPPPTVSVPGDLPPIQIDPPLVLVFRAFHDNHPEKAIEHLKEFDKPNQELLLQLIPAVVQSSKANLGKADSEEAAAVARQFEAAAASILKRAGFGIRKAIVCTAVDGFGVYEPVKDATALPRGELYSVYIELENVPCLPDVWSDGSKGFVTRLECEMRVSDEFGQTVQIMDLHTKRPGPKSTSSKTEFTRSPVRDYHLKLVLQTPARPGAYTVTFEVRDPRTGRSVSKPIPFRVQ